MLILSKVYVIVFRDGMIPSKYKRICHILKQLYCVIICIIRIAWQRKNVYVRWR